MKYYVGTTGTGRSIRWRDPFKAASLEEARARCPSFEVHGPFEDEPAAFTRLRDWRDEQAPIARAESKLEMERRLEVLATNARALAAALAGLKLERALSELDAMVTHARALDAGAVGVSLEMERRVRWIREAAQKVTAAIGRAELEPALRRQILEHQTKLEASIQDALEFADVLEADDE